MSKCKDKALNVSEMLMLIRSETFAWKQQTS